MGSWDTAKTQRSHFVKNTKWVFGEILVYKWKKTVRRFFTFNNEEITTEEMCRRLDQLIAEEEARVFQEEHRMQSSPSSADAPITGAYEKSEG